MRQARARPDADAAFVEPSAVVLEEGRDQRGRLEGVDLKWLGEGWG